MRLLWIALGVLVLDQTTKLIVRLNMTMGANGSISLIGDWLRFTFTENPGMAFGILPGSTLVVTACSVGATVLIVFYLKKVQAGYRPYVYSLAFVLGGAVGNIVDRLFYGPLFNYGPYFQGKVVDFIHFNLWTGLVPDGVPFLGGDYIALFPIFNVADIAICGGVAGVLIFQKAFHRHAVAAAEAAEDAAMEADAEAEVAAPVEGQESSAVDGVEVSSANPAQGQEAAAPTITTGNAEPATG